MSGIGELVLFVAGVVDLDGELRMRVSDAVSGVRVWALGSQAIIIYYVPIAD